MSTYEKIRCNSFKKIAAIMSGSKGVIHRRQESRVDDSFDSYYSVSTTDTAMNWLKANQKDAYVFVEKNILTIRGKYYFEASFDIYLDEADFDAARADFVDPAPINNPQAAARAVANDDVFDENHNGRYEIQRRGRTLDVIRDKCWF